MERFLEVFKVVLMTVAGISTFAFVLAWKTAPQYAVIKSSRYKD